MKLDFVFQSETVENCFDLLFELSKRAIINWKPEDYASFEKLTEAIKEILSNLGAEYKINFQDRVCIK